MEERTESSTLIGILLIILDSVPTDLKDLLWITCDQANFSVLAIYPLSCLCVSRLFMMDWYWLALLLNGKSKLCSIFLGISVLQSFGYLGSSAKNKISTKNGEWKEISHSHTFSSPYFSHLAYFAHVVIMRSRGYHSSSVMTPNVEWSKPPW